MLQVVAEGTDHQTAAQAAGRIHNLRVADGVAALDGVRAENGGGLAVVQC